MRSAADVSADASVFTPYAVYNTVFKAQFRNKWEGFGGTSLSAPLVAAMFALAGNTHSRHGAMKVWKNRRYLTDETEGNNLYAPVTGSARRRFGTSAWPVRATTDLAASERPTAWGPFKGR